MTAAKGTSPFVVRLGAWAAIVSTAAIMLAACGEDEPAGAAGSGGQGGGAAGQSGRGEAGRAGTGGAGAGGDAQAGAGGTAGTAGSAGTAGGDGGPKLVDLFVAQGHLGRTTVSCDDGETWVADRSDNEVDQCFVEGGVDCDHTSGAARGMTYGGGYFFMTFGWGEPGGIRRSRDGFAWETVLEKTTFAGVSFAGGQLVAGSGEPRWSDDLGTTWSAPVDTNLNTGASRSGGVEVEGGTRFLLVEANGFSLSSDGGRTWWKPDTLPDGCGKDTLSEGGIVAGSGVIVVVGATGLACRSTDGGRNWTAGDLGETIVGRLVWTGTEFMTWSNEKRYRSADGASWASDRIDPPTVIGAVAHGPSGTFVAVRGGWAVSYEKQEFYRSSDGLRWERLADGKFKKSHPINFIHTGRAICPTN